MPPPPQLETPRLLLRPFEERDRIPFRAMNADPAVMRFFETPFPHQLSDEHLARYQAQQLRDGFSMYAAHNRQTGIFLGSIGIQTMRFPVPNLPQPAVELGWRLTTAAQGQGYATEGARAVITFAFETLNLHQLVAVTAPINQPSRRVMEKVGMLSRPELTYLDARVTPGHPLQQHVLYSLQNPAPKEAPCSTPS